MKKVICYAAGCQRTSEDGKHFCIKHIDREKNYLESKKRIFTKRTTSRPYNYLYRTAQWRKARSEFLFYYPFCVVCGAVATIIDHIIPHRGNLSLFWDKSNWQTMCQQCHSAKTLRENKNFNGK